LWSIRSGQFDDMDGAASRILFDDEDLHRPADSSETKPDTVKKRENSNN
jgi:nitrogen fixation-related uncharacterized protein